jgi:RNA polymerase sigma factor (sigma-70 family)
MSVDDLGEIGSVTMLLRRGKDGMSPDAIQRLYERYIKQLEWVARGKMGGLSRRVVDEEDVASTAMTQFFLGVQKGQFPRLDDRHDLWQVLLMILDRRIVDRRRRGKARCQEVGESALMPLNPDSSAQGGVDKVPESAPTPQDVVILREEIECRLQQLPQERWRQVAVWKMEQRSHAEIAKMLDCSIKTVERILGEIRRCWQPVEEN